MREAIALILAATLTLGACGDDDANPGASSTTSAPAPNLDGRTFGSTHITENAEPKNLVAGTTIRLSFNDGSLGVSGGCNTGSGAYSVVDGHLRVEPMGVTEMACEEPRMAQDEWILALLGDGPALDLRGSTLTLSSDTVEIIFAEQDQVDLATGLGSMTLMNQEVGRGFVASEQQA